jgi:misacylated tRNA(Ala) deacylase
METELLYQTDSYIREFESTVSGVDTALHGVFLEQTAFYPGGGGQQCDHGLLKFAGSDLQVVKVQKSPEGIIHLLSEESNLPETGSRVTGILDWERRFALMRTHTAMHILCGVVFRDYGAQVTGGDMEPLKGRMDFEFESLQRELVGEIEAAVNLEITKDHPIHVKILPRDEAFQIPDLIRTKINLLPPGIEKVRTVQIQDLDLQADGGTHVHSTKEVGKVKIVDYKSKGKINKRIYLELID